MKGKEVESEPAPETPGSSSRVVRSSLSSMILSQLRQKAARNQQSRELPKLQLRKKVRGIMH